ncbi:MAG: glycosyltransferase [Flavobacteriaceae bacterium]
MRRLNKKIVFITPSLETGGSEKIIMFLLKRMKELGFNTQLIVIGGIQNKNNTLHATEIIYLNKKKFRNGIIALYKSLRKTNADILFSSVVHINLFLGFYKVWFPKIKCVARISSIVSKSEKSSNTNVILKRFKNLLLKKIDFLVYQSKDMKEDFEAIFPKVKVPHQIINNPVITPIVEMNKMTYADSKVRFITVGSLTCIKGHKRILESLQNFDADFVYEIYGKGNQKNNLEKLAVKLKLQTKVDFKGEVPFTHKSIKSPNTFYLLGSYFEGFPNAVIEALSFGVPVIAFQAPGGQNEIIVSGFNGFFAHTKEDYRNQILKSIQQKWEKNKIVKDIYHRFDAQKIAIQYKELFQNL